MRGRCMTTEHAGAGRQNAIRFPLGDDLVVVRRDSTLVHLLNPVARVVFESLTSGQTADEIVSSLFSIYEIDEATVRSDVADLQAELRSLGLLPGPDAVPLLDRPEFDRNTRQRTSQVLKDIKAKAASLQVPIHVQLNLTNRCNMDCIHCYVADRIGMKRK